MFVRFISVMNDFGESGYFSSGLCELENWFTIFPPKYWARYCGEGESGTRPDDCMKHIRLEKCRHLFSFYCTEIFSCCGVNEAFHFLLEDRQPVNRVNELRHQNFGTKSKPVINFGTSLLQGAEVNNSIELGTEVNIWCRSSQLGAEVTAVPKIEVTWGQWIPALDQSVVVLFQYIFSIVL